MSTEVRWRKGSTAEHNTFTGALAEVTVDTDKKTLVVHDGVTAGGNPLATQTDISERVLAVDSVADLSGLVGEYDGQQVSVKGYHTGSDVGGGIFYWDGTRTAENDGGMVFDGWVRILDGYVTPEMFGIGAGFHDISAIWGLLLSTAKSNNVVATGRGDYKPTTTLHFPSGFYYADFMGADFEFPLGVIAGFTIGDNGPSVFRGRIVGLTARKISYEGVGDTGIVFKNAVESSVVAPRSINFQRSIGFYPESSSRVAYNEIYSPLGQNHETGIHIMPQDLSSYANENSFFGGRFASFVAGRLQDQILCDNSLGSGAGHNRFLGVSIEGYSGGGSTGRSGARCISNANENYFSFCRAEKYGDGWVDAAYYFDASTVNNFVEDSRIDANVVDLGKNNYRTPVTGITGNSANGGDNSPALRYIRHTPVTVDSAKYAIDLVDTYASSGKVGALRYTTPRQEARSGSLVRFETGYGTVLEIDDAGTFKPRDNFADSGSATNRWRAVFAVSGVINTSDEREKTDLLAQSDAEKAAALEIKNNIRKFKFKDSVEDKGDSARFHFGVGAQTVKQILEKHGLNPFDYAFLCYDQWDELPEILDSEGSVTQEYRSSGDRYGIRYDELSMFILGSL
jgi:hypothetical protein